MARKTKKTVAAESVEAKRDRWYAGQVAISSELRDRVRDVWEAGQVACVTDVHGMHLEQFLLSEIDESLSGYVVIEWDDHGNTAIG